MACSHLLHAECRVLASSAALRLNLLNYLRIEPTACATDALHWRVLLFLQMATSTAASTALRSRRKERGLETALLGAIIIHDHRQGVIG